MLKRLLRLLPTLPRAAYQRLRKPPPFTSSEAYWETRYQAGGNSGDGSYRALAAFKAEVLNAFVARHGVQTVIDTAAATATSSAWRTTRTTWGST